MLAQALTPLKHDIYELLLDIDHALYRNSSATLEQLRGLKSEPPTENELEKVMGMAAKGAKKSGQEWSKVLEQFDRLSKAIGMYALAAPSAAMGEELAALSRELDSLRMQVDGAGYSQDMSLRYALDSGMDQVGPYLKAILDSALSAALYVQRDSSPMKLAVVQRLGNLGHVV